MQKTEDLLCHVNLNRSLDQWKVWYKSRLFGGGGERIALKNLSENNEIIINKANKGSTIIVILNKADYIKDRSCDPTVYRKLTKKHHHRN